MVIPLGGGMQMREDEEVPEKIRDSHTCWWWMMFVLMFTLSIGCCVAVKVFDGLITLMLAIWAYYMTKDRCKNMSQQCLFSFGFMCVIQAVFEFVLVAMSLPGRSTTTTTAAGGQGQSPHGGGSPFTGQSHSSSYTVTTKTVPFFSEEAGWHYNFQSGIMIASCLVFILGALLCRSSYGEYPNSMFDDQEEGRSISQPGAGGGRHYGNARPANSLGGGGGGQRAGPANSMGGGHGAMFGGSGQRLGS